jgi:hypothetical protein
MALLRSLPENATLADLRQTYADLLEKLRPYGHRLMRGPSPLTPGQRELIAAFVSQVRQRRPGDFGRERREFAGGLRRIGRLPWSSCLARCLRCGGAALPRRYVSRGGERGAGPLPVMRNGPRWAPLPPRRPIQP